MRCSATYTLCCSYQLDVIPAYHLMLIMFIDWFWGEGPVSWRCLEFLGGRSLTNLSGDKFLWPFFLPPRLGQGEGWVREVARGEVESVPSCPCRLFQALVLIAWSVKNASPSSISLRIFFGKSWLEYSSSCFFCFFNRASHLMTKTLWSFTGPTSSGRL